MSQSFQNILVSIDIKGNTSIFTIRFICYTSIFPPLMTFFTVAQGGGTSPTVLSFDCFANGELREASGGDIMDSWDGEML